MGKTLIRFKALRPSASVVHISPPTLQHHMTGRLLLEPPTSFRDPDPDSQDPHVFRPPGSKSISQRCGSGSGSVRHLHARVSDPDPNPDPHPDPHGSALI